MMRPVILSRPENTAVGLAILCGGGSTMVSLVGGSDAGCGFAPPGGGAPGAGGCGAPGTARWGARAPGRWAGGGAGRGGAGGGGVCLGFSGTRAGGGGGCAQQPGGGMYCG